MEQIDNKFFEEYKRLDKLCGEIFSCRNGVSEYITQMECTSQGHYKVSSWDNDYKALKHIRWVRNQIAHDTTGNIICKESDLLFVIDFYSRIINGEDPFAQLRKVEIQEEEMILPKRMQKQMKSDSTAKTYCADIQSTHKKGLFLGVTIVIAIVVLAIVACFFLINT